MIEWFSWLQAGAGIIAGLVLLVLGFLGRKPGDLPLVLIGVPWVLLVVQSVMAIVAPGLGNPIAGDPLEYWMYLVTAVIIPPAAVVWALVDRSRWSNVIMGVAALAVAVMVVRMQQIWTGHGPLLGVAS